MKRKIEIDELMGAASKARQLNALLQNIFEKGTDTCDADDELIGLAYDICANVTTFLEKLEREEDK
ncbi:hypothetical protein OW944_23415 [Klebsiella pneumoniae]|uniref:hypothetical protein n=1 Tax=Enterobacterales TaxID=91347 RepID=UPI000E5CEBA8|nr:MULTISPECIES: hypothetical protein [Enterobacterales]MDN2606812.1 hypothetical protein [Klebsiella variicola]MDU4748283.1 hypothetical protein [Pantoea sp.]AXZ12049.1 hypothetical protein AM455_04465 [Klebsiella pneumoniae]MCQ5472504.1 hypothetical protein [Pantoea brenneri]MCS5752353.1 hypothetical protein [Klebsiella quasipneumoniae subsp. quasipneumoniae]